MVILTATVAILLASSLSYLLTHVVIMEIYSRVTGVGKLRACDVYSEVTYCTVRLNGVDVVCNYEDVVSVECNLDHIISTTDILKTDGVVVTFVGRRHDLWLAVHEYKLSVMTAS